METAIIKKLYYSPVKSLSFSNKNNLIIKKNVGIENDRIFAFTRLLDKEESFKYEKYPKYRNLNFLLTLKNSPYLNKYNFEFINDELLLFKYNKYINKISLYQNHNFEILSKELMNREKLIEKIPYFIQNKTFPFFDTSPYNSISLINLESIEDLEKKIDMKIEHERFRANIYIKNADPWIEYDWLDKEISINDCIFKVTKKIPRCSATNLVPGSDISNINLPLKLKKIYDHINMGIYLIPLNNGIINIGNNLKF